MSMILSRPPDIYFIQKGSSTAVTTGLQNAGVLATLPTLDVYSSWVVVTISGDNVATQIKFGASSASVFDQFAGNIWPGNGMYLVPTGSAAQTSSQASVASNVGTSTVVFQRGNMIAQPMP